MDIFQGWYKDGTEGTRDYRPLSALYLLYRVALSSAYAFQTLNNIYYNKYGFPRQWLVLGMFNVFLGMAFFILQPYKQKWISDFDGWVFTLAGTLMLLESSIINLCTLWLEWLDFQLWLFYSYTQHTINTRVYRTCIL